MGGADGRYGGAFPERIVRGRVEEGDVGCGSGGEGGIDEVECVARVELVAE